MGWGSDKRGGAGDGTSAGAVTSKVAQVTVVHTVIQVMVASSVVQVTAGRGESGFDVSDK